jgi:hypothetical protein
VHDVGIGIENMPRAFLYTTVPLVTTQRAVPLPRYCVLVDDNFHYMNADERRQAGVYETVDKALAVCRRIVDRSVKQMYRRGMSAKDLYESYVTFGEDPFIQVLDVEDDRAEFSAWNYAKERCQAISGQLIDDGPAAAATR